MADLTFEVREYLGTALWADLPEEFAKSGFDVEDFDEDSLRKAQEDVTAFQTGAGPLWDRYDTGSLMHDFWLTRNGHGSGFWDGGYPESDATTLTALAKTFGETSVGVDAESFTLYLR